ncbi:MAG: trypsin-like serine protease [Planctomycetota bacterium]
MKRMNQAARRRHLICERLETRLALAAELGSEQLVEPSPIEGDFTAMMVAGESPDSPNLRVDANVDTSPFGGVGSITINTRRSGYICTGTPVSSIHIVTASHCIDINSDGKSNSKDGITGITFNINDAGTYSSRIAATSWVTHPDFTGFNRPSVNDDIAIITLSQPIPATVPRYGLFTGSLAGQTITMVGYGQSGDGINGYTVNASYTVKRVGQNVVDAFYAQDDAGRTAANEVFRFDFDRANGTNGPLGGPSLGNLTETTLGGGDSGGPSFVFDGTNYLLAGVNTFSQSNGTIAAPKFGSLGGGMAIPAYADWINSVVGGVAAMSGGGTAGGGSSTGTAVLADAEIEAIRAEILAAADELLAVNELPQVSVQQLGSGRVASQSLPHIASDAPTARPTPRLLSSPPSSTLVLPSLKLHENTANHDVALTEWLFSTDANADEALS